MKTFKQYISQDTSPIDYHIHLTYTSDPRVVLDKISKDHSYNQYTGTIEYINANQLKVIERSISKITNTRPHQPSMWPTDHHYHVIPQYFIDSGILIDSDYGYRDLINGKSTIPIVVFTKRRVDLNESVETTTSSIENCDRILSVIERYSDHFTSIDVTTKNRSNMSYSAVIDKNSYWTIKLIRVQYDDRVNYHCYVTGNTLPITVNLSPASLYNLSTIVGRLGANTMSMDQAIDTFNRYNVDNRFISQPIGQWMVGFADQQLQSYDWLSRSVIDNHNVVQYTIRTLSPQVEYVISLDYDNCTITLSVNCNDLYIGQLACTDQAVERFQRLYPKFVESVNYSPTLTNIIEFRQLII